MKTPRCSPGSRIKDENEESLCGMLFSSKGSLGCFLWGPLFLGQSLMEYTNSCYYYCCEKTKAQVPYLGNALDVSKSKCILPISFKCSSSPNYKIIER
jgi:hypothetical protein